MFTRLLGAQPGQQAGPPGRSGGGSSSSAIRNLGSPAAMHGQRPPEGGQGRSYEFTVPGGGSGRIVIGGFGGGGGGRGGGGFMLGGGSGAGGTGQNANPWVPWRPLSTSQLCQYLRLPCSFTASFPASHQPLIRIAPITSTRTRIRTRITTSLPCQKISSYRP